MTPWHEIGRYAQRCPSPHNTQPFRLRVVSATEAEIVFVAHRGLPAADPLGRFTWLTAGIFVEICTIAAHGLGHEVTATWRHDPLYAGGDAASSQTVALLRLGPAGPPVPDLEPELILRRQTSRLPYDGTSCPPSVIEEMKAEAARFGQRFETRSDAEAISWVAELNERALFHDLDDDALRRELTTWLRFDAREESLLRDGLSARCLTLNGRLLRSFFTQHRFWTLPGIRHIAGAVYRSTMKGIGTIGWLRGRYADSNDWVAAGRVMIRLWLLLTRHGLYWHPYGSVITNESARQAMIDHLHLPDEANGGNSLWLLLRLGASATPPTSLRLPLQDIILGAS